MNNFRSAPRRVKLAESDSLAVDVREAVRHRGRFRLGPVSLQVPRGTATALVGPNGSGKTTLMKMLMGAARQDSGYIRVLERKPGSMLDAVTAVFDTEYLVPDWTIHDVASACAPFYTLWDEETFENLLVRLSVPREARVKQLSRGELTKLKLALALAPHPDLLILDEPTSGLDPLAREIVVDVMKEYLRSGVKKSVIFSTHIADDIQYLADDVLILRQGEPVHSGPMKDLTHSYIKVQGPPEWFVDDADKIIGLRMHQGFGIGVVPTTQASDLSDRLAQMPATVEDVIKAYAVVAAPWYEQLVNVQDTSAPMDDYGAQILRGRKGGQ